jgi:hypothetical protein
MNSEGCGHAPGHHTINCRPPGTMAEALGRLHDAIVELWEALPSTRGLYWLVAWLARKFLG